MAKVFLDIVKVFIHDLVEWAYTGPSQPGQFTITVTGEESTGASMPMANRTLITLPPIASGNPEGVAKRQFEIVATDSSYVPFKLVDRAWDDVSVVEVMLIQGTEVTLKLTDFDAAENASPLDDYTFTPTDVTAPSKPGPFNIEVAGETEFDPTALTS